MRGLSDLGRINYTWHCDAELPRPMVKLGFLLIQCLENALPFGGAISVWLDVQGLKLTAVGQNVRYSVDLWDTAKGIRDADPDPATVQFPLAKIELERLSRSLRISFNEDQRVVMAGQADHPTRQEPPARPEARAHPRPGPTDPS